MVERTISLNIEAPDLETVKQSISEMRQEIEATTLSASNLRETLQSLSNITMPDIPTPDLSGYFQPEPEPPAPTRRPLPPNYTYHAGSNRWFEKGKRVKAPKGYENYSNELDQIDYINTAGISNRSRSRVQMSITSMIPGVTKDLIDKTLLRGGEHGTILSGNYEDLHAQYISKPGSIDFIATDFMRKMGEHVIHTHPTGISALSVADFLRTPLHGKAHSMSAITPFGTGMTAQIPASGVPKAFLHDLTKLIKDTKKLGESRGLTIPEFDALLTEQEIELGKKHGVDISKFSFPTGLEEISYTQLGKDASNTKRISMFKKQISRRRDELFKQLNSGTIDTETVHRHLLGASYLSKMLDSAEEDLFIALRDNKEIVGGLLPSFNSREAYIEELGSMQSGVGTGLVTAFEEFAKKIGTKLISLIPTSDAEDFYRMLGYSEIEGSPGEWGKILSGGLEEIPYSGGPHKSPYPEGWDYKPIKSKPDKYGWYHISPKTGKEYYSPNAPEGWTQEGKMDMSTRGAVDENFTPDDLARFNLPSIRLGTKGATQNIFSALNKLEQTLGKYVIIKTTRAYSKDLGEHLKTTAVARTGMQDIPFRTEELDTIFRNTMSEFGVEQLHDTTVFTRSNLYKTAPKLINPYGTEQKGIPNIFASFSNLFSYRQIRKENQLKIEAEMSLLEANFKDIVAREEAQFESEQSAMREHLDAADIADAAARGGTLTKHPYDPMVEVREISKRQRYDNLSKDMSSYGRGKKIDDKDLKEKSLSIGALIDGMTKKGGALSSLSWQFASVAMSSMGVYFSLMGIVGMIQQGLSMIFNPLRNVEGLVTNYAQAMAFTPDLGMGMENYKNEMGITLDDMIEQSLYLQGVFATLQTTFAMFATKVLKDTDVKEAISEIVGEIQRFLLKPESFELVKGIILAIRDAMPGILRSVAMLGRLIKDWLIPHAEMLAFAWAASLVIQPLVSIVSFLVNITKLLVGAVGLAIRLSAWLGGLQMPKMLATHGGIASLAGFLASGGKKGGLEEIAYTAGFMGPGTAGAMAQSPQAGNALIAQEGALATRFGALGTKLGALLTNPITIALVGALALFTVAYVTNFAGLKDVVNNFVKDVKPSFEALANAAHTAFDKVGGAINKLGSSFNNLFETINGVGFGEYLSEQIRGIFLDLSIAVITITDALTYTFETIGAAFDWVSERFDALASRFEMLQPIFDAYGEAMGLDKKKVNDAKQAWVEAHSNKYERGDKETTDRLDTLIDLESQHLSINKDMYGAMASSGITNAEGVVNYRPYSALKGGPLNTGGLRNEDLGSVLLDNEYMHTEYNFADRGNIKTVVLEGGVITSGDTTKTSPSTSAALGEPSESSIYGYGQTAALGISMGPLSFLAPLFRAGINSLAMSDLERTNKLGGSSVDDLITSVDEGAREAKTTNELLKNIEKNTYDMGVSTNEFANLGSTLIGTKQSNSGSIRIGAGGSIEIGGDTPGSTHYPNPTDEDMIHLNPGDTVGDDNIVVRPPFVTATPVPTSGPIDMITGFFDDLIDGVGGAIGGAVDIITGFFDSILPAAEGGYITQSGLVNVHKGELIGPLSSILPQTTTTTSTTTNSGIRDIHVVINGNATPEVTDDMIRKIKKELGGYGY